MKAIFTFTCLLIACALFSQASFRTAISTAAQNDDNDIFKVIQLSDGSYAGVGTKDAGTNGASILVAKLSATGSITSSKLITNSDASEDDEGVAIIKTSDGGFAVSGTLDDLMTIVKMDAGLNIVWQKQYAQPGYTSQGARLVQTPDGGYIVVGALYDTSANSAGYLVKTDAQGNVIYAKQYFQFEDYFIDDIKATKDGNYALLAGVSNDNFNDTTNLVKIKPNGDVLWSRYINTDSLSNNPITLLQASDGALVTAGFIDYIHDYIDSSGGTPDTFQIPYPQILINKFDASGNLLWSKTITSSNEPNSLAYSVSEDKDGGYLFCGFYDNYDITSPTTDTGYAYIAKISPAGNLVWTKTLNQANVSDDGISIFSDIESTSDGGFVVSGYGYEAADSAFNYRGLIYKFDNNGVICGTVGSRGTLTDAGGRGAGSNVTAIDLNTSAADLIITSTSDVSSYDLCNILPLKLLSFKATLQNKSVSIEWKTSNEINTDHFTIERSGNGVSFTALQTISARGNSSSVQTYTTSDLHPLYGTSHYRLKQLDKDGRVTYSNVVQVRVSASDAIFISPNPVVNDIHVNVQSMVASKAILSVADMTGKTLFTQTVNMNAGTNAILIPAATLLKGLYVLKITSGTTTQSLKFIKE